MCLSFYFETRNRSHVEHVSLHIFFSLFCFWGSLSSMGGLSQGLVAFAEADSDYLIYRGRQQDGIKHLTK
jgi:hypothetical protein